MDGRNVLHSCSDLNTMAAEQCYNGSLYSWPQPKEGGVEKVKRCSRCKDVSYCSNLVQLPVPLGVCSRWYSKWRPENPLISLKPDFARNPFIPYIAGPASSHPEGFLFSGSITGLFKVNHNHTQNQFEWLPLKCGRHPLKCGRHPLKCWWSPPKCWCSPPKCWWHPLKWGEDHQNDVDILLA